MCFRAASAARTTCFVLLVAGDSASERDGAWCGLLPKRVVSMNTLVDEATRLALRIDRAASVANMAIALAKSS